MTERDKMWVVLITFITVVSIVFSIIWWPGWLWFIAMQVALGAFAVYYVKTDDQR